jgi:L-ascorbate metabolism protein UlaG (beta-lactamase superfamily)
MTTRSIPAPEDLPESLAVYFESPATLGGVFQNPWGVNNDKGIGDLLKWQTGRNPWRAAKRTRPVAEVLKDAPGAFAAQANAKVAWAGHASVLTKVDDVTVLIDPVFGSVFPGIRRLAPAAFSVATLPHIDAVLLSHGHYDHLDGATLKQIAERFPEVLFVTPTGLSRSLPRACRNVVEVTWWESVTVREVDLCLVPAQHWHRRALTDMNRALWGGWVVRGSRTVYHSGDTGFFEGFEAIGRTFDIDVAVLPIGAWAPRWFMGTQHMDPDGTVEAFRLLGAKRCMAMHWGTFDLTDEPVDEGPRELAEAVARGDADADAFHVVAHGATLEL